MLIKYSYMIYIPTLFFGTMITCTASSWMVAWVGLEINLMGFIPLVINKLTPTNVENAIKYFLIQAMASMMIIMSILLYSMNKLNFNKSLMIMYVITMSLGLKAGVAPVHFWFPQVMSSLNWLQVMVLSTWQKIAPLILLSFNISFLTTMFIITSSVVGAANGMNQMMIKKILAFSSIINISWMLALSSLSMTMWWVYFVIYSLLVLLIISVTSMLDMTHLNMMNLMKINSLTTFTLFINILSLAGLPPLAGFYIKLVIIELMVSSTFSMIVLLFLLAASVISLYFYMRLMFVMMFQSNKKSLINFYPYMGNKMMPGLVMMSIMLNMALPLLVYLF